MDGFVGVELKKFGETTSMRGIPRAVKHQDRFLRLLWTSAVSLSLSVILYQLYLLLLKYFQYPTTKSMWEYNTGQVFPALTVCNTNPLNIRRIGQYPMSWPEYQSQIADRKALLPLVDALQMFPTLTNTTYNELWILAQSPSGYIANLPISSGDSNPSLVVACDYYSVTFDIDHSINCMEGISYTWDSNYYECATFTLPSSHAKNVRGLTAVFFTNDTSNYRVDVFQPSMGTSRIKGLQVSVFPQGTSDNMEVATIVGAGTESSIRLDQETHIRMTPPYGQCLNQTYLQGKSGELYSTDKCNGICRQQQIVNQCGCLNGLLPFNADQQKATKSRLCMNSSLLDPTTELTQQSVANVFQGVLCMVQADQSTSCNCAPPCKENTYTMRAMSSAWPHKSYLLAFYDAYIKENSAVYGSTFDVYGKIESQIGNWSDAQIMQALQQQNLIESNFMQLSVLFDTYTIMKSIENATLTWETMVANIGGCCGLWMGITTMAVVEIFELAYKLVVTCYEKYFNDEDEIIRSPDLAPDSDLIVNDVHPVKVAPMNDPFVIQVRESWMKPPDPNSVVLEKRMDKPMPTFK